MVSDIKFLNLGVKVSDLVRRHENFVKSFEKFKERIEEFKNSIIRTGEYERDFKNYEVFLRNLKK